MWAPAQKRAKGADERIVAMRADAGGNAEVPEGCMVDASFVKQLMDDNARLRELHEASLEASLAHVEERHNAQLELMELRWQHRLHEAEAAHARELARALRSPASSSGTTAASSSAATAATAQEHRTGNPARPGRGPGRPKIKEEVQFGELEFDKCEFLMHWEITDAATMHNKLGNFDICRLKAYWDEDKQCAKRQAKARSECFLNLLSLETGKWNFGNSGEMLEYMMSTRDIGTKPGEFRNRRHQVATWLWPKRVHSYDSLTADTPEAKYIDRRAHNYMTAVRGVYAMYEVYMNRRAMPEGHVEGVDPIPSRGAERKRKAQYKQSPPPPPSPPSPPPPQPPGCEPHDIAVDYDDFEAL